MPAVSREHVSSLLNFIVQLASHIWVLESLGGWEGGGRGGKGAKAPSVVPELDAAPQDAASGAGGGGDGIPPKVGDTFQILGSKEKRQGLERGQLEARVFFSYLKKIKAIGRAHTGFLLAPFECPPPTPTPPAF